MNGNQCQFKLSNAGNVESHISIDSLTTTGMNVECLKVDSTIPFSLNFDFMKENAEVKCNANLVEMNLSKESAHFYYLLEDEIYDKINMKRVLKSKVKQLLGKPHKWEVGIRHWYFKFYDLEWVMENYHFRMKYTVKEDL